MTIKGKNMFLRNFVSIILTVPFLAGCVHMYLGNPEVTSMKNVGRDEIVVVGKIELVPKLDKDEQKIGWDLTNTGALFEGKAMVAVGRNWVDFRKLKYMWVSEFGPAPLGKTFFLKADKSKELIYSGSIIQLEHDGTNRFMDKGNKIYLPSALKYKLGESVKAIYIGHIRYHRNEFNEITKVDVLNDYTKAKQEFEKKFGKKYKLISVNPKKYN